MSTPFTAPFSGEDVSVDAAFDQAINFRDIIQPDQWQSPGDYYRTQPDQVRTAVESVVANDAELARELREKHLPDLVASGRIKRWERADDEYINDLREKMLYSGRVYATDGTLAKYETLSMVGAQIGISRVNYQGDTGQIVTNLMQWGKEVPRPATAADIRNAIESRGKTLTDKLPNVFLQALMLYKERQVLLDCPHEAFKLIHGPVFPFEMLTGAGKQHILKPCLDLIGALIDDGNYASIISHVSPDDRPLIVLGRALHAGEYIVLDTGTDLLNQFEANAHYTDTRIPYYGDRSQRQVFTEFKEMYGARVVRGVLRAHWMSPPFMFYCNASNIEKSVHLLLADASHTPRGFPLLIDMADLTCAGLFKQGDYTHYLNAEFARAAGTGIYQSERSTRNG